MTPFESPVAVPYAYTLSHPSRWDPPVFPTLVAAVAYLIKERASAWRCLQDSPIIPHYADPTLNEADPYRRADLTPFIERVPVNEEALRADQYAAVMADRARFKEDYPNGRPPGSRFSGDTRLCEMRPEELESMLRREIERRSWAWKALPL